MKKILSLIFAFAILAITPVLADDEVPTYSFDTAMKKSHFTLVDKDNKVNFKIDISSEKSVSGGALKISVDNNQVLEEDYHGVVITADKLGIESFAGYKIRWFVMFPKEVYPVMNFAQVFSNGNDDSVGETIWTQSNIQLSAEGLDWGPITIDVPSDATGNTLVGLKLPLTEAYSGAVCYVDNVFIYDQDGNLVANDDGYVVPTNGGSNNQGGSINIEGGNAQAGSSSQSDSGSGFPFVPVIFGVLIVGAAVVVVILILKAKNRFY